MSVSLQSLYTPQARAQLQTNIDAIGAKLAEASLRDFVQFGWHHAGEPGRFESNWHIDAICDHLTAVADGGIRRLLINIPPRHMKSLASCVFFPAWLWAQNPDPNDRGHGLAVRPGTWRGPGTKFMFLSYSQDLSMRDSVKSRRLMESAWYKRHWGDRFGFTSDTQLRYINTVGGHRISTSVGGRVTGDGGDIIMFDDPHNVLETESPTVREKVLRFWDESMQTRLNDQKTGVFIIIMQRVHETDLSGHVLAKAMGWDHLCLPAFYEPDHPFQVKSSIGFTDPRAPGEPLWVSRFPKEVLESWGGSMSEYAEAGQLQQRPAPRSGGTFKREWFEVVDALPSTATKKCRSWDLAGTEENIKSDPDYTAGAGMAFDPVSGVYYIFDMKRDRLSPGGVEQLVKNTATQDGHGVSIFIPQDPAQAGKFQIRAYAQTLRGFALSTLVESSDKESRADAFATQCEFGNVKLVRGPWNAKFLDEAATFPKGAHDDQIDAAVGAFRKLTGGAGSKALSGSQTHN